MPQCRFCGEPLDSESGLRSHRGQKHQDEIPWHDADTLRELYIGDELSTDQIARELGCNRSTVLTWLKRHEIETRDKQRAQVVRARREGRPATLFVDSEGYEVWRDPFDGAVQKVRVHRLLAVAEYGFGAVSNNPVHHGKEGGRLPACEIPWANWRGNIEVLGWGEHSKHHNPRKLSWFDELRVNELYQNGDCSQRDLAAMFEIAQSALSERYLW